MKGTIRAVVAALAAAPVLALAACGSGTNTAHRAGVTAPGHQPAAVQRAAFAPDPLDPTKSNPVAILRKLDAAPIRAHASNGEWTPDSTGLYASGMSRTTPGNEWDAEHLYVFSFSSKAARDSYLAAFPGNAKPDDQDAVVLAPHLIVDMQAGVVSGNGFGGSNGLSPTQVAHLIHGTLAPGSPR